MSEQEVTVEIQLTADLVEKLDRLQHEFGLRSRSTLIQKLLEMTYDDSITLVDLRLDPGWDKLREDERFRALVAE